jgi:hypothetical protein
MRDGVGGRRTISRQHGAPEAQTVLVRDHGRGSPPSNTSRDLTPDSSPEPGYWRRWVLEGRAREGQRVGTLSA